MSTSETAHIAYNRCFSGDRPVLAENPKTRWSLNVDRHRSCRWCSSLCRRYCYAKAGAGPISFPWAEARQRAAYDLMVSDPERAAGRINREARNLPMLRCFGCGDAAPELWPTLARLTIPWYGYTRNPDAVAAFPGRFVFSMDVSSHAPRGYTWKVAYVRRPGDPVDERADIVFPAHGQRFDIDAVPADPRDCPAVRHRVASCFDCRRWWPRTGHA